MASQQSLTSMAKTALGMARVRAAESRRPDRLFDDPYAQAFLTAAPEAFSQQEETRAVAGGLAQLGAAFYFHGVIRTRFFDDYLLAATTAVCHQVVLLAAGLDTRAFRLAWSGRVRLFELDLPEVLAFKEQVLAAQHAVPRCQRTAVAADLRRDWPAALLSAGFQPAQPTAWLAEGLLIYLSAEEATRLLTAVGELSTLASQLAFEHGSIADSPLLTKARAVPATDQFTRLWKGGLGIDAPDLLARQGWQVQIHDRAALAAAYGRVARASSRGGFVTAVRLEWP